MGGKILQFCVHHGIDVEQFNYNISFFPFKKLLKQ